MGAFSQGVETGRKLSEQNPFNVILSKVSEVQARRHKEDLERKKEEGDLKKALQLLSFKNDYDNALMKATEGEKRKTGLLEGISKGEIVEANPEETQGVFEGTPFGALGKRYKRTGMNKEERTLQNQDLSRATQLRKEFIDRPEVKEFVSIRNKVASMDSLLKSLNDKNAGRVALDQGLITLFNKVTDPNSVVRESEYERTPTNLSMANRFKGAFEKFKKGGAGITKEDAKSIVFGAKIIANSMGKMFNEKIDQYSKISSDYGVDPKLVVSGMTPHSDFSMNDSGQQTQGNIPSFASEQEALASGQKGTVIINGKKARID